MYAWIFPFPSSCATQMLQPRAAQSRPESPPSLSVWMRNTVLCQRSSHSLLANEREEPGRLGSPVISCHVPSFQNSIFTLRPLLFPYWQESVSTPTEGVETKVGAAASQRRVVCAAVRRSAAPSCASLFKAAFKAAAPPYLNAAGDAGRRFTRCTLCTV